jgi:hypothetical protein
MICRLALLMAALLLVPGSRARAQDAPLPSVSTDKPFLFDGMLRGDLRARDRAGYGFSPIREVPVAPAPLKRPRDPNAAKDGPEFTPAR